MEIAAGEQPQPALSAAATPTREAAAALLRRVVAAALLEGTTPAVDGVEAYRQKVSQLLSSATPACGGILQILLALFTQEEAESVVASAAQALGTVAQVVGADEELKREMLLAPSTLLKSIKQLVRRLGQLAQKRDHGNSMADIVDGTAACLRALGGTVRPQCALAEEACLHLLDSPHANVRRAVAACFAVRPWCGGIEEWPAQVGSLMATTHELLDLSYPTEPVPSLRKGLPASFKLPHRAFSELSVAWERRLGTLFTTLRYCLSGPPGNQPARAVPVPIPHLLSLISRVLALSAASIHFDSLDRIKLGLWTMLPSLHAHAYRLLSSLIACVGRHLLPHYADVRRLIVNGLERNAQVLSPAWGRPLLCLLESIGLAFPVLASCLWKDCATSLLSLVLPLLVSPNPAPNATQRAVQLSAIKVVGAVLRHAGPLLSSLHAIEIHSAVLAASTKAVVSHEFQEEARRVLGECCLLPQTAPMLPGTLRALERDAHTQAGSAASATGVAMSELLMHPRVLPRVRLAPPPMPTAAAALAAVPLAAPAPAPVRPLWDFSSIMQQAPPAGGKRKPSPAMALASDDLDGDEEEEEEEEVRERENMAAVIAAQPTPQLPVNGGAGPAPKRARTTEAVMTLEVETTTVTFPGAVVAAPPTPVVQPAGPSSSSSSSSSTSSSTTQAAAAAGRREEPAVEVSRFAAASVVTTASTPVVAEEAEIMTDIVDEGPDSSDEDEGEAEGEEDEEDDSSNVEMDE